MPSTRSVDFALSIFRAPVGSTHAVPAIPSQHRVCPVLELAVEDGGLKRVDRRALVFESLPQGVTGMSMPSSASSFFKSSRRHRSKAMPCRSNDAAISAMRRTMASRSIARPAGASIKPSLNH